ncbi:POL2 [Enterospora canceri]|uniref:RNA-directed DNA polymerase n=1 Tax=Enterospora canceri TaxID=1081671 RepID=A0A1Y1S4R4_9MICR|nr:POL2 [Enterospora canceri]
MSKSSNHKHVRVKAHDEPPYDNIGNMQRTEQADQEFEGIIKNFAKAQNLREYNGNQKGREALEWLESLIVYEEEWSSQKLLKQIAVLLKGKAKIWFKALENDEITNFEEFKVRFKAKYGNQEDKNIETINLFKILSDGPRNTLSEWILLIKWKNKNANLEFDVIRSAVNQHVYSQYHEVFDRCENILEMAEKAEENNIRSINQIKNKVNNRPPKHGRYKSEQHNDQKRHRLTDQKEESRNKGNSQVRCYECGGDHYRSSCPKLARRPEPKRVNATTKMKDDDHIKDNHRSVNNLELEVSDKEVENTGSGIVIKDKHVFALIDTGANCSFIAPRVVDALNLEKISCDQIRVKTASQELSWLKYKIRLTVQVGQDQFDHEVYVFNEMNQDVILGMDFLRKADGLVDAVGSTVRLNSLTFNMIDRNQLIRSHDDLDLKEKEERTIRVIVQGVGRSEYLRDDLVGVPSLVSKESPYLTIKVLKRTMIQRDDIIGTIKFVDVGIKEVQHLEIDKYVNRDIYSALLSYDQKLRSLDGFRKLPEHAIRVIPNVSSTFIRQYRLNQEKISEVVKQTKELVDRDRIQESCSQWNFPLVLVKKKNGKWRMCVDFKKLNDVTTDEKCSPPLIEDCLDALAGATVFSTLDLDSGYHQIRMDRDSSKYTAFTTPIGRFEYKVMPFGLKNAPACFQSIMFNVLQKFINKTCIVYLDDIIIYSHGIEQHVQHVREILLELANYGLRLNFDKCEFALEEVSFLGFTIGNNSVRPNDSKKKTILAAIAQCNTHKKLHSILGMLGYFRSFIHGFTSRTRHMYQIINQKSELNIPMIQKQLTDLTTAVFSEGFLQLPDINKPFIIETDASGIGIGGVLKQSQNNSEKCIRFVSRTLRPDEQKWSATDLEALSIIYCIKKFQHYLHGRFTLRTDHKPLLQLQSMKDPVGKYARWRMFLNQFSFDTVHIPGRDNNMADYLSRTVNSLEKVSNEEISRIISAHRECGHACPAVTYVHMKNNNLGLIPVRRIKEVLDNCKQCIHNNRGRVHEMRAISRGEPFGMIGIDCMGPLPKTAHGNKFIILCTDYATGWVEGISTKNKSADNVKRLLWKNIFTRFGPPSEIRCDCGREFTSSLIRDLARDWNCKMRYSAPYAPYSNGRIERTNQSIILKLSKLLEGKFDWDELLELALFSQRITPNARSGISPYQLVFGREVFERVNTLTLDDKELYELKRAQFMSNLERIMTKNELHEQQLEARNKGRSPADDLKENDLVVYKTKEITNNKFGQKFIGPFTVVKTHGHGTCSIRSIETGCVIKAARKDLKPINQADLDRVESVMEAGNGASHGGGMLPFNPIVRLKTMRRV